MTNGFSCKLPGCGYSTTSQLPAEVDQFIHFQLMDIHFKVGCVRHAAKGFNAKDKADKLGFAMKPEDVTTSEAIEIIGSIDKYSLGGERFRFYSLND